MDFLKIFLYLLAGLVLLPALGLTGLALFWLRPENDEYDEFFDEEDTEEYVNV